MYSLLKAINSFVLRLVLRLELKGMNNLPRSGSYIAASNHLGVLDALLVYHILDRRDVILMIAEKYQKYALVRWLVREVNAIWLDRFNADVRALRVVMRRLQEGSVLVIAPEGTRSPTGALIEARPGGSYLAAKAGVPLVPVAVTGSEDANVKSKLLRFRRAHVIVRVGKPFILPPLEKGDRDLALERYTNEIMCQIAVLMPQAYRGFYADHPRTRELEAKELSEDKGGKVDN
jgi:1-acyl-sn-glycerol-3-phosphate acyltransferase